MDPSQPPAGTPAPAAPPPAPAVETVRDQDKMMLFLAYFGIFSVVPYMVIKDSDYVRWHAKQGMTLCGAAFGLWICFWIFSFVLHFLHLWFVTSLLGFALTAGLFLIWIIALIKAFQGERWRIPIVADIADMW
ncbi:MAG: DUF4870 domain-containing protein [Myxococcales bacterium]